MPTRRSGAQPNPLVVSLPVLPVLLLLLTVGILRAGPLDAATAEARLQLRGDLQLGSGDVVGVAAVPGGWVLTGADALTRVDESANPVRRAAPAIPPSWRASGYERLGDLDAAGGSLFVPFEQADSTRGRQAVARFDPATLSFLDAVELPQHEIAFVAVDAKAGVAYSMDRVDGDQLLRYDVAHGWRPMSPLGLGLGLQQVRGGAFASGALWLATDDARHGVYRVDPRTGAVSDLGSAGHLEGRVGGVDATTRDREQLHVAVADGSAGVLTGFAVVAAHVPAGPESSSGWPPVLVMGAVALLLLGGGASAVLVYRAWVGLRPRPRRT